MTGLNVIVDLSHHNRRVDLGKAAVAGILGITQKATQGTSFTDPTFTSNRDSAKAAALLFAWSPEVAAPIGAENLDTDS